MHVQLPAKAIIELHEDMLEAFGGLPGIKDEGFIDYIAKKPFIAIFGEEQYPDLFQKAAVLFHGIATAHAFFTPTSDSIRSLCVVFTYQWV